MTKPIVMIVDDEPNITRIAQVNLERAGYATMIAHNGIDALAAIQTTRPAMILLDVIMPYMDGFEALQQIRNDPVFSDIPVVMMTARSRDADIVEGKARGANHYLTKPISPRELVGIVRDTIGEPPSEAS